jgi:hypothetical protein
MDKDAKDVTGRTLKVGQTIVRVRSVGGSYTSDLEVMEISRIEGRKVWLNNSRTPMVNPQRLAIIS